MKARTLFLSILAVASALLAANVAAAEGCEGAPGPAMAKLVVENLGLRAAQGQVTTTVYPDDTRRFLAHHGKLARTRVPAVLPATYTCFWLPPGTYAVAVYHDQNKNGRFDRSVLGFPAEGFGFSNDAPTHFGQPSLSSVRFVLPPEGRTVRIQMRYQTKPG